MAQVILNRVTHPAYPSSVCGVIYQGFADPVCQFSYTCDGSLARRPMASLWRQSREVAAAALGGYVERSVGSATHYHADYVVPYWAYRLEKVRVEGRHIFYRFPGSAGRSASFVARWNGRESKPAFNPDRFADRKNTPRFAYLPFGDGPRICIGASFALQEAVIVLATLLSRFRFTPVPGRDPKPVMILTLRPEGGVWLMAEAVGSNYGRMLLRTPRCHRR